MTLDELTQEYNQKLPLYNSFRERLHSSIRDITQDDPNILALDSRVKTLPSLVAKAKRMHAVKAESRSEPPSLSDFNDLVGVRVIVNNGEDVFKVVERIVRDLNAETVTNESWPDDSRYQRVHLAVSFDGDQAESPTWSSFRGLKAEIQIKSALADAYDNVWHQSHYELLHAHNWMWIPRRAEVRPNIIDTLHEINRLDGIIDEFSRLLEQPSVHEKRDIHSFLDRHRFILHPNPERIWSEVPIGLGTEHQMDFLIQEADGEFLLVELENPRHRLFLKNSDFSAPLNHAQRQVEDWQDWVEENISTMQKKYPGIISPRGLVIIGRSKGISESDRRKLRRRNVNLGGRLRIITYDELIASARRYVESIRRQLVP